mgnify:CR=1 FL=1
MDERSSLSVGEGYFFQYCDAEFGQYTLADEELHVSDRQSKPHYSLTETQYYGFFVPEENIHCFTWIWYHPNLNTVTAGTMAFQGHKPIVQECELYDFRAFMSGDVFANGFMSAKFDNGLSVEMTEPGRQFRLTYADDKLGNRFDVLQSAVSDPLMWPTSHHFEQVMKCEGELTLRGRTYQVDCLSVRDRSFSEYRLETPLAIPPNSWVTATFDESFSFCVVGMDHPDLDPVWKGDFEIDPGSLLRFGWMVVDGEQIAVRTARTKIDYDRVTLLPRSIVTTITDTRGREYHAKGEVTAAAPLDAWMNARTPICLVKWECQGRSGIGEIQQLQFSEFIRAMRAKGQ